MRGLLQFLSIIGTSLFIMSPSRDLSQLLINGEQQFFFHLKMCSWVQLSCLINLVVLYQIVW